MLWLEDDVTGVARAELQTVIGLKLAALHAFAVQERAMLAALVDHKKFVVFRDDDGMIARHTRVADHQILLSLTSYREWRVVNRKTAGLVALDHE